MEKPGGSEVEGRMGNSGANWMMCWDKREELLISVLPGSSGIMGGFEKHAWQGAGYRLLGPSLELLSKRG